MKILLIENDDVLVEKIGKYLGTEGYRFEICHSPAAAMGVVNTYYYDAIIFNLQSLDPVSLDLLNFLRGPRLNKKTLLTFEVNSDLDQQKVDALGMRNLPKPYSLQELYTRINAVVSSGNISGKQAFQYNELMVDAPGRMVRVHEKLINLTRLEFDLLLYLLTNNSKVVSKNALAQYLTREVPEDISDFSSLYAHVKNLKKKLKAAGCNDYIQTVYGIGYRFSL